MTKTKLVVGLTGGIGSGKSEVSRRFAERGVPVVDADIIAREVVKLGSSALEKIREHFGYEILTPEGELNRAKLRDIIFVHNDEKLWLEELLHPLINHHLRVQLLKAEGNYVILCSPLLLETKQYQLADRILVVDTSEQLQIERACSRDKKNEEHIKNIINNQLSRQERCSRATDIIQNHGNLEELDAQVEKLHQLYLEIATATKN
jgi:dephospho-CoA kinase